MFYHEMLPPLNWNDLLIRWPMWGHLTFWKIYISTLTRLIATKLGRVLTSGRSFSMQTLTSPPCSFLFWIIFNSIKQTQNLKEKTNYDFDKLKQLHVLIQHPTSWYIHFIQRCNYELCLKHNFSRKNQRIIFSTKSITGSLYYNKSRTRYSQKMNQFALNALQWSNPFSRVQSFHLPIYSIII